MQGRLLALGLVMVACGNDARVDDDGGDSTEPDAAIDASPPIDAPPDAAPFLIPDTPANTWTWVEIPGTTCANGSPFGIGVNRSTVSDDITVFFAGGGACWTYEMCFGANPTATHIEDTYTQATLTQEVGTTANHNQPGNPLGQATTIFVPYCTGDLHAGSKLTTYTMGGNTGQVFHTGSTNTAAIVDALATKYTAAEKVFVYGASAGGYGATLNFHLFATAFPTAERHLLQDGSPFVNFTDLTNYTTLQTQWAFVFPPNCTGCPTSFPAIMDTVGAANPTSRIGLLSYTEDAVIGDYFGFTPGMLTTATNNLVDNQYDLPNTKAFIVAGTDHVMLGRENITTGPANKPLDTWLAEWVLGLPAWETARP